MSICTLSVIFYYLVQLCLHVL
uniref:Uncharacterized protein n=1 Tax=Arundo donax TaxID=35708 RepID=A0A0A9EXJ4_ARUDO